MAGAAKRSHASVAAAPTSRTVELWSYVRHPERLRRESQVRMLYTGGSAYPAMLDAIASAQHYVLFEMYIFRDDAIGRQFQAALIERARAGVRVNLLVDALGSFGLPAAFVRALAEAGVEVIEYHPVAPWRPRWGWNQRDHKKIMVVDGRVGFTGGINIGMEYMPTEQGGGGWYDWHVEVQGPIVADLEHTMRHTWVRAGGTPFHAIPLDETRCAANCTGVQVISNVSLRTRWRMFRAYLHAIDRARKSICIMNSYFIPELRLRRAFVRAAKRGVDVRVVVPSHSDVMAVRYASRHLSRRLIANGVRIFEWPEHMMHAKCGIIDSVWATVGSYNIDRRSLLHNLEVGLVIVDHELGAQLQDQFEIDVTRCRETTLEDCERLSAFDRARDWFWFQMRALL